MSSDRIQSPTRLSTLEQLGTPRLLVLGDLILDRYTWGNAQRISPEAPVLVLSADHREARLGGAASVSYLVRGLEAEAILAGTVGEDLDGREISSLLTESEINSSSILALTDRATTVKERFIGRAANRHPQQILRVDHENSQPIDTEITQKLTNLIAEKLDSSDALLISDYDKGVCSTELLNSVITKAVELELPVIVDPARIEDYGRYRGATLLTPNRIETQVATGIPIQKPDDAIAAGQKLCQQFNIQAAVITLDRDGMMLVTADGYSELFPTLPRDVYDITGAGDMVLAMLGICLASETPLDEAVRLANVAAGLEVERVGVEQVTREEIVDDLTGDGKGPIGRTVSLDQMCTIAESLRRQEKSIVFTNGCFDLLHKGHLKCLREAAKLGDMLVVGLNSDASVRDLKGPDRPVNAENDRAELLSAIDCVDYVVIFDEETPHELLRQIRPDCLVKGGTYSIDEVVGREVVEEYGGKVYVTGVVEGVSTTQILEAREQQ